MKRLLRLQIACIVLFSLMISSVAANTNHFTDVQKNHFAYDEIYDFVESGFIKGYGDGRFGPEDRVKRKHVAVMLQRIFQFEKPSSLTGFSDVAANHPYANDIYAMKEAGIFLGSNGRFLPDDYLTREQMATILVRAFQLKNTYEHVEFLDEKVFSTYHLDHAKTIKQHGLTIQEQYNPKGNVTRAQYVLFLHRALSLQDSDLIPLEYFFQNPEIAALQVSPNGEYLAYLKSWNNRLNVFVRSMDSDEEVRVTSSTDRDITSYGWLNNETIIYLQDHGGDENYSLYATNLDGTNERNLTPYENTIVYPIDFLKNSEDEILIQMNKRNPQIFDVYRLNVKTNELTLVAENPGQITTWVTDNDSKLRLAVASDGNVSIILYRDTEEEDFRPILQTELGDEFYPLAFTPDNNYFYAASNIGRDKMAIVKFDPVNLKEAEVIYQHPRVDVSNIFVSEEKKDITAVAYIEDKVGIHFFDKKLEEMYNDVQAQLPNYEVSIIHHNEEKNELIVAASNDRHPGSYYYYNLASKELTEIAVLYPWLDEELLAEMKPISYTARDGLTIHGYLTLPQNVEAKNLPVIVNPHGGPWARDVWGYNPEVQFLASRGYAVLQMNFRGSTGYGKTFLKAGNKQWGKAMQDDITDGVHWLIEQGIADPERIGIYGASYGGYATLAGLAFTPDLYAAGVSYVGPSNLFTLLESLPPHWESEREKFYERIGHPERDYELLRAASPLFHADQIQAPLFIAQGANDPRVKQAESDQIVEALRDRGINVPYMLKENEGHGFRNVENQFEFYYALERFFNEHLANSN